MLSTKQATVRRACRTGGVLWVAWLGVGMREASEEPACNWFQGRGDPLEKETATHSSILAWEIPWTEEPGGLQSMGSQRLGQDLVTKQQQNLAWALCSHCGTCCLSHNQLVIQGPVWHRSSSCYRKQTRGCGMHLFHSGGRGSIRRASSNNKCLCLAQRDFDSMCHDNVFQQSAIENVLCTRQCP